MRVSSPTPFPISQASLERVLRVEAPAMPAAWPGPRVPARGAFTSLGLERDARMQEAAIAPILAGTPVAELRAELEAALTGLWGVPAAALPEPCLAPLALVRPLLAPGDTIWLSGPMAARQRQAVEALAAAGWAVETVTLEAVALAERLDAQTGRVWLVADGLDGRNGQEAPLEALWMLLAEYEQLHLVLDESWHMGWHGRGGRGAALEMRGLADRLIVLADLGAAFGAELAVMASPRAAWVEAVQALVPAEAFEPGRLGQAIALAALHAPKALKPLQTRLMKRLQVCDRLLKAHRLPQLGGPNLPFRLVAAGSARVAYAVAGRLMAEGVLASVAMVPGPSGPRAALRFQPTLAQPLEELQAMVDALARHLGEALAEAGSSHEALCEAHGLVPVRPSSETIDMAHWRSNRPQSSHRQ